MELGQREWDPDWEAELEIIVEHWLSLGSIQRDDIYMNWSRWVDWINEGVLPVRRNQRNNDFFYLQQNEVCPSRISANYDNAKKRCNELRTPIDAAGDHGWEPKWEDEILAYYSLWLDLSMDKRKKLFGDCSLWLESTFNKVKSRRKNRKKNQKLKEKKNRGSSITAEE